MTDTSTLTLRAYHIDPEHYTNQIMRSSGLTPTQGPPAPSAVAREQLSLMAMADSRVLDLSSITEAESMDVIVDDAGEWRPVQPGERRTGRIVTWTASATKSVGTDAADPVITAERVEQGDTVLWMARLPEEYTLMRAACRIKHTLGEDVTVRAFDRDGAPTGYLLSTPIDAETVHVEFLTGTGSFLLSNE